MIQALYKRYLLNSTIRRLRKYIQQNGMPNYELLLEKRYRGWLGEGDVVIDIGAHQGRHLKVFKELIGPNGLIMAFEPLPFAYQSMVEMYSASNVSIFNVALSDSEQVVEYVFNEGAPEESGLKERIYNEPMAAKVTKIECNVKTLDSYTAGLKKIDFIKIDIEGGEIGCLGGAIQTVQQFRPLISVEYGFPSYSVYGHSKDTLFELAKMNNYILYDIFLNSLEEKSGWDLACDSVYWDYFMVPKEREKEFLTKVKRQIMFLDV